MKGAISTLVFTHGGGRFGNQLFLFAHLLAMAKKQGDVNVINAGFWPYCELCEGTFGNPLCFYSPVKDRPPILGSMLASILETILRALPAGSPVTLRYRLAYKSHQWWPQRSIFLDHHSDELFRLSDPGLLERIRRNSWNLICGWRLREWEALKQYQDEVRNFIRPRPAVLTKARAVVDGLRNAGKRKVVGLYLRRTDYAEWENGRFYFNLAQYVTWMRQIASLLQSEVVFVIAADQDISGELPAEIQYVPASGAVGQSGQYIDSFAELSLCDLILSPPSTFSAMAAFIGIVPILPLIETGQMLRKTDILAEHLFAAGEHPAFSRAIR